MIYPNIKGKITALLDNLGKFVIRVDAYFLYQVGAAIRPLTTVTPTWAKNQLRGRLWAAENWLDLLLRSVYKLQTCRANGNTLLETIKRILTQYEKLDEKQLDTKIDWLDYYFVEAQATAFETVLGAELQWGQLYLVEPKGGYDLIQLMDNGIAIFPSQLTEKVSESIEDAKEAARCIAFALPTAAAFHLHRLHELVLRRYYETVTNGAPRPVNRNIGAYIDAMKNAHFKDQKIFSALASLKDFHRNPVLHPDDRLEDVEEAIALLGSINTSVIYMLKAIAPAPLQLTSPPSEGPKAIEVKT